MLFRLTQWIRLFLYNNQALINRILKFFDTIVVFVSIGILVYNFGFPADQLIDQIQLHIIRGIFTFYILQYFIKMIFSIHPIDFIRLNILESILLLLLIPELIVSIISGWSPVKEALIHLGLPPVAYMYFMMTYLLTVSGFEFLKVLDIFSFFSLKASSSLVVSLLVLSFIGAVFLTMPESTTIAGSMSFFEALFTSVSAISQTGLILQDTGSFFTLKGQIVIMILIQVGALGIISFGTFFGSYISSGANMKNKYSFQDFFFSDSEIDTTQLFKNIMYYTIAIDVFGALFIYFSWGNQLHFAGVGDKMFWSLFHSVSAFCNAGFSLMGNGLYTEAVREVYGLHFIIMVLVFLGSIGYPTLFEVFSVRKFRQLQKTPWKRWKLDTRLSFYTSIILVFGGGLIYYLLEKDNTLDGLDATAAGVTAVFQSTMRTAGFNTVDISAVGLPMLMVFCFLMFVGGSSASVCGGIKTSTFALTLIAIYNAFTGKRKIEIGTREIPDTILGKALSIWFFALTFILACCFTLTITDPQIDIMQLVFEQISAFGTVGLSTGITTDLSLAGKTIIMISMFVGRVGTTTVAFALIAQATVNDCKYPEAKITLG